MKAKKIIFLVCFISTLVAITILAVFAGNYLRQKKELDESLESFLMLVESGNLDGLTLTINYASLTMDTPYPWGIEKLVKFTFCNKIVIDGDNLEEHFDLLKKISNVDFAPVMMKPYLDARIYYIFETEEDGKILDVAMWGHSEYVTEYAIIFVNGTAIKATDVFYEIIIPFLPEVYVKGPPGREKWGGLNSFLSYWNPENTTDHSDE